MAGIAGTTKPRASSLVYEMLNKMKHRGNAKKSVMEEHGTTYGISWNTSEDQYITDYMGSGRVADFKGGDHFAWAKSSAGNFELSRDKLGVAPLYYGWDHDGHLYFASEIKALIPYLSDPKELEPGTDFTGTEVSRYFQLSYPDELLKDDPEKIALMLRAKLEESVERSIRSENTGSWLSGGLDSSTISALAAKKIKKFRTFAAGIKDAPDLEYAREVAKVIRSGHHEVVVSIDDMIKALPDVIWHLESFDALLVRSSITNFLVAKRAADYVSDVF
jgi:asparagine synthase (glutamine-hydrolysing)